VAYVTDVRGIVSSQVLIGSDVFHNLGILHRLAIAYGISTLTAYKPSKRTECAVTETNETGNR